MEKVREVYGVGRSLVMYYGIPLRRRKMVKFYEQFIDEDSLCFDIGAHVGNRVRTWLDIGAQVVAVEPQPKLVSVLRNLYGRKPGVTILPVGVAEKPGLAKMHISTATPTMTSFATDWMNQIKNYEMFSSVKWDKTIDVGMITLDDMIDQYGVPDFCKIDVEGFETEVLKGLSQQIKTLSFEFIPAAVEHAFECVDLLEELGPYKFNWSKVETMELVESCWLSGAEMKRILAGHPREGRSGDVYAKLAYQ